MRAEGAVMKHEVKSRTSVLARGAKDLALRGSPAGNCRNLFCQPEQCQQLKDGLRMWFIAMFCGRDHSQEALDSDNLIEYTH